VLSPCLVFATLLRSEIAGDEALRLAGLMMIVVFTMSALAYGLARFLHLSGPERSGFMLTTAFMNSGNYGLPATRFAFGEVGFQFAVVGYLTQAVMAQTFAVYIASAGNGNRRAAFGQVFRLPLIYAVVLALSLRFLGIRMDETDGMVAIGLFRGVRLLADATLPFLLLILGMQLVRRESLGAFGPVGTATGLRLVASLPIAYAAGLLLGLSDLPLQVGVIQAAMPTAVNMTILALEFNAWPQFVSNVVVITTLGSLVTLTILFAVLR
jgi:predicted permease